MIKVAHYKIYVSPHAVPVLLQGSNVEKEIPFGYIEY